MSKFWMMIICMVAALVLLPSCAITEYNPKTGMVKRTRVLTDSDIQGFLAEIDPNGTVHVEWESARSEIADTLKALVQYGIEIGKQLAVLQAAQQPGVTP